MDCPRNAFGQLACCITAHPDRPTETFCATCNKAVVEKESFHFGYILAAVVLAIMFLSLPPESSQVPPTQPAPTSLP